MDIKPLLDRRLLRRAEARLGDYSRKLFLSLPPKHLSVGALRLGTVLYDREHWPFGLRPDELTHHMAIYGRSGSGKSNQVFVLLEQLVEKGIPVLFLDLKRTARHMLPRLKKPVNIFTPGRDVSLFPFNPLVPPPGMERDVYLNMVIDALASATTLGDGARSILQTALLGTTADETVISTVRDLLDKVEAMPATGRQAGWKVSVLRALRSLVFSGIGQATDRSQESMMQMLAKETTILELDALSAGALRFLVPLVCLWLYQLHLRERQRERLKQVVIVEEAHHFFYRQDHRAKESLMDQIMRQCREMGMGMVIVDQHPHLISSSALGNTATTICLNLKDPADINKAAALCLVPESTKSWFSKLPVGQGIVKLQDRWREPFLTRIPHCQIDKGSVSDEDIRVYMRRRATGSRVSLRERPEYGRVPRIPLGEGPLKGSGLALLEDVSLHPSSGVKERYTRLGLGVGTGHRLKESLVTGGWLLEHTLNIGKTRKRLLSITPRARTMLGLDNLKDRPSLVHEYWKHYYAQRLQEKGFEIELEAPRVDGCVDVLATKEGIRVGLEVETGKSNAVKNVRNGLRSGFHRVVVVATDRRAMKTVERQLAHAGLILPSRVELVLGGQMPRWVDVDE